jgi:hypothetical protein
VVLDAAGRLWTWGNDGCAYAGQLPQQGEAWKPRLVQGQLQDQRVAVFDVGKLTVSVFGHCMAVCLESRCERMGVQQAELMFAGVIQPMLLAIGKPCSAV